MNREFPSMTALLGLLAVAGYPGANRAGMMRRHPAAMEVLTVVGPRELRPSFVSLLSASGVRIEDIARLVGHSGTAVTEKVYRHQLHAVLNERRRQQGLTWADLAVELDCTPARLTNLRTARQADMGLALRVTQWLRQPAAAFVYPAEW